MNRLSQLTGLFAGLLLCILACQTPVDPTNQTPDTPDENARRNRALIQRSGQRLVLNGQPVQLNGVGFGNCIWDNAPVPSVFHHNEQDYARLQASGLNVVRFYMNYTVFESDAAPYVYKQTGWNWLNQNIAWAKKHNIYLILTVFTPQGGYQSQGNGNALWNVPENQNRFTAMWREIARRYRTEPTIAGYDLLNEPVTTQSIDQWKNLAQRLTTAIRQVDKDHLVIVERLNGIAGVWKDYNGERNMFLINDANVMYQFHFYDPFEFTHQTFEWAGFAPTDVERYPDENKLIMPADAAWYGASTGNPVLAAGSSPWTYYEGVTFKVEDPKMKIGQLVCVASAVESGRAYFDDMVVKEYDAAGQFVRDVVTQPVESKTGWYFWSRANTGSLELTDEGHSGKAFVLSGSTNDANASQYTNTFLVKTGHSYRANGWMRGENVPANATAQIRIDFQTTNGPVMVRNKEFLRESLRFYADWGKKNNVPIYMGEYGAGAPSFRDGRGGGQWVNDMIDLHREFGFHTTYHAYHEDAFGWYFGYNTALPDPANANTALIDLFRQKFGR